MPAAGVTYIQTQERSYFRMKGKDSFEIRYGENG
jgi:hypothetical protein